ncbi:hypothetical protein RN001_010409 [Aquatica leii]|uniref:SID1 transmembrane family member 1 n=1 Tax=Aquatica leii TaxID=1421715 RepID=A0AAN7SNA7_9COLE|nr:hypothetical protein RN001_010409 [Aquatica leii]
MFILLTLLDLISLGVSLNPPIIFNATYQVKYNREITNDREHVFVFNKYEARQTARVLLISNNATTNDPLMVVAKQHKEILSWQLPLIISSDSGKIEFNNSTKTLCPDNITHYHNFYDLLYEYQDGPIISVSTASTIKFNYTLQVDLTNIFVEVDVEYDIIVSPSKPLYYFYNFPKNVTDADWDSQTVLLKINSKDDVCMLVSIQNASCPIYDQLHDIKFEGYWETVDKQGGITISKRNFPNGFFVVFVAQSDDSDCVGFTKTQTKDRNKNVTFVIKPSISYRDYLKAVGITIGCIVISYFVLIITFCCWSRKDTKPREMNYVDENDSYVVSTPNSVQAPELRDDVSMDETEYDTITEVDYNRELILTKPVLYLSDLARKDPRVLKKKSYFYLWHVLTVALFYGLPVVQLVITYQKVLNDTGDQDLCYYNFLCAHPLGFLSDFNHLFSNIGYVTFGLLFLFLVYKRERLHKDDIFEKHFGIPQHYGLYYAIGAALVMEGVLSGSYHICPNHSNFQFDSSFMYVIAVLCIVKLYQTRHPDINATAYSTFSVLAVAILLGMIGVLEANLMFWILFTVLHLSLCLIMTAQIYYFGYWKLDKGVFLRVWQVYRHDFWASPRTVLRPLHKGRMVLLVLGNLSNWGLAVAGIYNHERDFATYLLAVFMCNTMLYFIFYIVMKLLHKERIKLQPLMYLVLSIICAISAIYFFYNKSISWALTPAQSRWFNQECKLLQFYDYHDIWHFLSAIGMFFSFMMLLTLDDDLSHSLRTKIAVF